MSFNTLIEDSLEVAFDALEDLVRDCVLLRSNKTYNWAQSQIESGPSAETRCRCIFLMAQGASGGTLSNSHGNTDLGGAHTKDQMLIRASEATDFSAYDRIVVDGVEWRLGSRVVENRFFSLLDVHK